MRRYSIENYLLEPAAVAEELRVLSGSDPAAPGAATLASDLLEMCRQLSLMMAANWLCHEARCGAYYPEAHDIMGRDAVVEKFRKDHACSKERAAQLLAEKEALLGPLLIALDTAHTRINGKHLLFHVYKRYTKTGINKDQFRSLLARTIKEKIGLHADIRAIVEDRILA